MYTFFDLKKLMLQKCVHFSTSLIFYISHSQSPLRHCCLKGNIFITAGQRPTEQKKNTDLLPERQDNPRNRQQ
jgi:hypothetical protein